MQISGLVTGLDTQALVKQLMSVERQAGTRLTTNQTAAGAMSQALTRLNGLVKSMGDAARVVGSQITSDSIWQSASAVTNRADVATATASNGAAAGALTFTVDKLASAGAVISDTAFTATDQVLGNTEDLKLKIVRGFGLEGEKSFEVNIAGGATISDVAKSINEAKSGVNATVVKVGDSAYRLQLTSNSTGAVSNITLEDGAGASGAAGLLGSMNTLYNGDDAQITVGTRTNGVLQDGAYEVKSSTNDFKGLLPGVTLSALKADSAPVTVTIKQDVDAMASKVQAMVDAANAALDNIRINSKADLVNKGAAKVDGVFVSDPTTRGLTNQISNVFVGSSSNLPSIAGVSIDKTGAITFNKSKFAEAFAKDPVKVESTLTATAKSLETVAKNATDASNGALALAIKGQDALVKNYTDQIKKFNERMDSKEDMLTRQYTALDSLLSKMKSQSDWLAGQLKSLPSMSNSSN